MRQVIDQQEVIYSNQCGNETYQILQVRLSKDKLPLSRELSGFFGLKNSLGVVRECGEKTPGLLNKGLKL